MGIYSRHAREEHNAIPESGVDAGWQELRREGTVASRTAFGAAWIVGWRFVNRFLGIISTVILARILVPADFGVVSLAMAFVQGLQQLAELGTENAIIRADMPDRQLYNTGFTINVIRGFGVALVLLIIAYPAGLFFNSPHFTEVAFMAAVVSAISSLQNIGVVDYRRYMAFDREFLLKLIPRLISVVTAVTLAFILKNYWALIIAILINVIVNVILSYFLHPYRPSFTLAGWPRMASYSTLLWLSNIVSMLSGLGTRSTITKMSSVASLGLYEVASEIAQLPSSELVGPMTRALFSGLSEIRNHADRGAGLLVKMITTMNLIVLPLGVGLSLVAEPAIRLAFGDKWLGAVPLLQILALGQSISIFGQMGGQAFAVHGWMMARLKISIIFGISIIVTLIAMIHLMGLPGIAVALVGNAIVGGQVYFIVAVVRLDIPFRHIMKQIWRGFVGVGVMAWALNTLGYGWFDTYTGFSDIELALKLLEIISIGATTYTFTIVVLWLLSGRPQGPERLLLDYIRSIVISRFNKIHPS